MRCTSEVEDEIRRAGYVSVAGVDEAGRGALFGPVYAAAVVLDPAHPIAGLADSKTLSAQRRSRLAVEIRAHARAWAVARAEAAEIDRLNIYQASRLAMLRAVSALAVPADYLLLDALTIDWPGPQRGIIKGDAQLSCIAAASILAKTERDACLQRYDQDYPGYGLARHKGYPTAEHHAALRRLGPTNEHRSSYAPVARWQQVTP
jgi:ribonuclease HII